MAKCWLSGSLILSDTAYIGKRIQFYKRLVELDPMRTGQYKHYLKLANEKVINIGDHIE